ncbi:MAG: glycogen/starch/alpha-glucan phosphorylase [Oscillospiraceae bacterium]|jgi:starch phosphorylase|nr:glycogen/starch/alpha-glucan phosphorylase [Oscillospiraceae bacterium]
MTCTPEQLAEKIQLHLRKNFARTVETATREQIFKACALALLGLNEVVSEPAAFQRNVREVHYLSLEFLLGRSLMKNAFNLGCLEPLKEAAAMLGLNLSDIAEEEPDPSLGNGGLGRLAACYLEAMTTQGICATGYSVFYEYGMFKQGILDGMQVELPDPWFQTGEVWWSKRADDRCVVSFEGRIAETERDGRLAFVTVDDTKVLAVPIDMTISGYGQRETNRLRVWKAENPPKEFSIRKYTEDADTPPEASESESVAEDINMVLYPNDKHQSGKLLRLRQQYFLVSATAQDIVRRHKRKHGPLSEFHVWNVIQINDTHPTLIIPELMRIFLDEEGMDWEEAWRIVCMSVAYTNHTVMAEALECWQQSLIEKLLPRIWTILEEINKRYLNFLWQALNSEKEVGDAAIIWNGQVRMANLCVHACFAVNGVSALHSDILTKDLFASEHRLWEAKFRNVTNGIDHRRWLAQINPRLHNLVRDLTGSDRYLYQPEALEDLTKYQNDASALEKLAEVKRKNKLDFARYLEKSCGVSVDPDSVFDVQVKRLHEYKRQLMNALHILHLYNTLKDTPDPSFVPHTFFFGAKAAPSYTAAKRIIELIHSLIGHINADPAMKGLLSVVFLQNYRVSVAEQVMPASELSEQISTAGKEASGTGNMKFMLNGALTLGTLDGANVEIADLVGRDNIFLFGLKSDEVARLTDYSPLSYIAHNPALRRVLDQITDGLHDGKSYADIANSLQVGGAAEPADRYLLMADFDSYAAIHREACEAYRDRQGWNRRSLINIAKAGFFAADRSVTDYARDIWHVPVYRPRGTL